MMPGAYNLTLYRGDTFRWRFTLWTDNTMTTPVDLTAATANAEIRDKPAGTTIVALTTDITLPNIIDVTLTGTTWTGVPNNGAWDLQITYPTGDIHTAVAGKVTVTADITASTPTSTLTLPTPLRKVAS